MQRRTRLIHVCTELWRGRSIARVMMNDALSEEILRGRVLDVGGGRNPDYFRYFKRESDAVVEAADGSISGIDFEKDSLPAEDGSCDTVLMCNILEHVFNHQFLLKEAHRILKADGVLIGFVPFWVGYHPDPHDFFRYTDEALQRMLQDVGFHSIRVRGVGAGPVIANFNTIMLSFPRVMRPLLYIPYVLLDTLFVFLRPGSTKRNPLGFVFTAHA